MNNLMLIDNVLYALYETEASSFVLKSEVEEVLKTEERVMCVSPKESIRFNGKYYAYVRVKQKKDEQQTIL